MQHLIFFPFTFSLCFIIVLRRLRGCLGLSLTLLLLTSAAYGQEPTFGDTTQLFPQFVSGGGWTTYIAVHNSTPQVELVTVELFRSDGSGLLNRIISLGPDETQRFSIEPSAQFSDGWAKLSSEGRFSATMLFQLVDSGRVISEAGVLPADAVQNLKLMGSVHLDQALTTGIAIANPSSTMPSVITVRRLSDSGSLLGTGSFTLGPLQHLAKLINEDPFFAGIDGYDGIIEIAATEPIIAVGLRLDGAQMATLPAITPDAGTALTANSVNTIHLVDGAVTTPKLADKSVTADKVAPGSVVKSINSLKDDVNLSAGKNIAINAVGNTLVIDGSGLTGPTGPQGPQGPTGATGATGLMWKGDWSPSTAYAVNEGVQSNGASYIAIQAGTNNQPDPISSFWTLLADKG